MTDLDKAREWAEDGKGLYSLGSRAKAVIDIILSLPDQWVDAEKLERIIAGMDCCLTQGSETNFSDGFKEATTTWRDALKALLPPKLPTLADMTQEERAACQWMQCEIDGQIAGILARVDEQRGHIWIDSGYSLGWKLENITPLPDLPKLKWPGGAPDDVAYATGGVLTTQDVVDECRAVRKERALPRPEDVPDNELWLVEHGGNEFVAKRNRKHSVDYPWRIASTDGEGSDIAQDSDITLIHKLVPETPALPEGMRLADHAEYGRVVVSPYPDAGNDYRVFYSRDRIETETGASWGYANKNELTFLDGGQHV